MLKKIVLSCAVLLLVSAGSMYFWAHTVLGSEVVRGAVARQISAAIGQPVRIGGIRARAMPRVTITLTDVGIGAPEQITMRQLDIGASLRALLSRRIEHATVTLVGARVSLPLPPLVLQTGASSSEPALQIVSVDEVMMRDVAVVSGGRTMRADVELVPDGSAVKLRRVDLTADGTTVSVTGRLDNPANLTGDLAIKAERVDALALLAFAGDFMQGARLRADERTEPTAAPPQARGPLRLALNVGTLTFGTLALDEVEGEGHLGGSTATLEAITFRVFDGTYDGRLAATLSSAPAFTVDARLAGLDMAAIMRFAGTPGVMTGRLSGRLSLTSRGNVLSDVVDAADGHARVEIADGSIPRLGLVRAIVVGTSMRTGTSPLRAESGEDTFTRLSATAAIQRGLARTHDLRFESPDVLLTGQGTFALDGSRVALDAEVQFSDALSKQAGRDLVRYTATNGRVTLPATISGRVGDLKVSLDLADVTKRAIVNRAKEEAGTLIRRGVDRLLGREGQ